MQYLEPAEARGLPGLRLALTVGFPAPYSMSARAILDLRQVPYVAVAQYGAQPNAELVDWTRHRNAPVAVYDDEPPRTGWLDILNLAERLGTGPSLVPEDVEQRMAMVGLINELIGENGFVWHLRLIMLGLGGPERAARAAATNPMYKDYGYSEAARDRALERARRILEVLTARVHAQRAAGSPYLLGDRLSALDVYWAYFSQLLRTVPEPLCPMPAGLRKSYDMGGAAIGGFDERLIEQRDWILREHLSLPMTF